MTDTEFVVQHPGNSIAVFESMAKRSLQSIQFIKDFYLQNRMMCKIELHNTHNAYEWIGPDLLSFKHLEEKGTGKNKEIYTYLYGFTTLMFGKLVPK